MKKLLLLLVLLGVRAGAASAQTTTITASSLKMAGAPITTGTVTLTPVNLSGTPIAFADGTGSQNGPTAFACKLTTGALVGAIQPSGSVSGTCSVPDATQTIPANILYSIQVCDTSTGLSTSGKCYTLQGVVGVSGTTWALDHYGPPAQTTNVATLQAASGSTTPSSCIAPSVFTNIVTHAFYTCVGGALVAVPGVQASASANQYITQTGTSTLWVNAINTVVDVGASCPTPGTYDQTCWTAAITKAEALSGTTGNFKLTAPSVQFNISSLVSLTGLTNVVIAGNKTTMTCPASTSGCNPFAFANDTNLLITGIKFASQTVPTVTTVANLPASGPFTSTTIIAIDRDSSGRGYIPTDNDTDLLTSASGGTCTSHCISPAQLAAAPEVEVTFTNSTNVELDKVDGYLATFDFIGGSNLYVHDGNYYGGGKIIGGATLNFQDASEGVPTALTSISRASGTVTLTLPSTSGFAVGQFVQVTGFSGSNVSLNGSFVLNGVTSTTLTYTQTGSTLSTTGGYVSTELSGIRVENNVVQNASFSPIWVRGADGVSFRINQVLYNGESGIKIGQDYGGYVSHMHTVGNFTDHNWYDGLDMSEDDLSGNTFWPCNCLVEGNFSHDNHQTGIVSVGNKISFKGNNIHDNQAAALLIDNVSNGTVEGNLVTNNGLNATTDENSISVGSGMTLVNNLVTLGASASRNGIFLSGTGNTLESNIVADGTIFDESCNSGGTCNTQIADVDTAGAHNTIPNLTIAPTANSVASVWSLGQYGPLQVNGQGGLFMASGAGGMGSVVFGAGSTYASTKPFYVGISGNTSCGHNTVFGGGYAGTATTTTDWSTYSYNHTSSLDDCGALIVASATTTTLNDSTLPSDGDLVVSNGSKGLVSSSISPSVLTTLTSAWTHTAPTATCYSGSTTSTTNLGVKVNGKTASVNIVITGTAGGTCTGGFNVPLPFTVNTASVLACTYGDATTFPQAWFGTIGTNSALVIPYNGNVGFSIGATFTATCNGVVETQ